MILAVSIFVVALLGIGLLFAQKAHEVTYGTVVLPGLKSRMDSYAQEGKILLERLRTKLEHLPPVLVRLFHAALHKGALAAAAAARYLEHELHRLAEIVSHKHTFERREPRNEFLRQVGEAKNESGLPEKTGADTVQQ